MAYKKTIIFSALSFLLSSCAGQNEYQQQLLREYPSSPATAPAKKEQADTQAFSDYLRCKESKNRAELQGLFVSMATMLGLFTTHSVAAYNPEQSSELKQDCQFPSS